MPLPSHSDRTAGLRSSAFDDRLAKPRTPITPAASALCRNSAGRVTPLSRPRARGDITHLSEPRVPIRHSRQTSPRFGKARMAERGVCDANTLTGRKRDNSYYVVSSASDRARRLQILRAIEAVTLSPHLDATAARKRFSDTRGTGSRSPRPVPPTKCPGRRYSQTEYRCPPARAHVRERLKPVRPQHAARAEQLVCS